MALVFALLVAGCGAEEEANDTCNRDDGPLIETETKGSKKEIAPAAAVAQPPEPPPLPELPPSPPPDPPRNFNGGPVEVTFRLGNTHYAELKIDDKLLRLQPKDSIKLQPGYHDIEMRHTYEGDAWERIRRVPVEAGGPQEIAIHEGPPHWEVLSPAPDLPPPPADPGPLVPLPITPSNESRVVSPVVGSWREVARIPCHGGSAFEPYDPIDEFDVWTNGTLSVTFRAFETYRDYNGEYQLDLDNNKIVIMTVAGNYIPADMDRQGRFKLRGNKLTLRDMWLGSSRESAGNVRACGHVFKRR